MYDNEYNEYLHDMHLGKFWNGLMPLNPYHTSPRLERYISIT